MLASKRASGCVMRACASHASVQMKRSVSAPTAITRPAGSRLRGYVRTSVSATNARRTFQDSRGMRLDLRLPTPDYRLCGAPDVVLDLAVADVNRSVGVGGHLGFVRDQDDRVA